MEMPAQVTTLFNTPESCAIPAPVRHACRITLLQWNLQ